MTDNYNDEAYDDLDVVIGAEANSDYTVLPKGVYAFSVVKVDRERYGGGDKIPPCWNCIVTIEVDATDIGLGKVYVTDNLYMTKKRSWKIRDFFVSIGLVDKSAESFTPQWNKAIGEVGVVETTNHEYNGNTYNDVKKFLEPAKGAELLAKAMTERQPTAPAPAQGGFNFPGA